MNLTVDMIGRHDYTELMLIWNSDVDCVGICVRIILLIVYLSNCFLWFRLYEVVRSGVRRKFPRGSNFRHNRVTSQINCRGSAQGRTILGGPGACIAVTLYHVTWHTNCDRSPDQLMHNSIPVDEQTREALQQPNKYHSISGAASRKILGGPKCLIFGE